MQRTDLSRYNNAPFNPGGSGLKRLLWYYVNLLFFKSGIVPISGVMVFFLRLFGADIGRNVTIKPGVSIKYPWHLKIGEQTWIGEKVWIDCLVPVTIGANVCVSQGAVILTGSHNYKKATFDLLTAPVVLEDGVWIGAGAIINLGVRAGSHAVLTSGSVATKNLDPYSVFQGNPAIKLRDRLIG
ncbi:MAG TPA: WcaF family extracellular polysaccharide biosynthesis acetyltransferase [Mucilaginibacter sp.]|nr:WcaF family extracellular polysaccharide biosynthesis acetyltransferase [Mucilaginibacter sp.]